MHWLLLDTLEDSIYLVERFHRGIIANYLLKKEKKNQRKVKLDIGAFPLHSGGTALGKSSKTAAQVCTCEKSAKDIRLLGPKSSSGHAIE